ncbi:MAG TPA: glycosyltransferase family 39 protein [Anaerolineales bacterium]|nr:glycosyltransferase family 39 protein [Anaerolineales bacterium]
MYLPRLFIKASTPIASIFLILAGLIQLRAQFWTAGIVCIALAMLGFILSIRLFERKPFTTEEIETLRPFIRPVVLWTIVFSLLAVSVLYVADNFISIPTNRMASFAWVASVFLGLVIVWWRRPDQGVVSQLAEKIRIHRVELIFLLILMAGALALRTIDLSNHPYPWSGDEASIGKEALRIINGEVTNYFDTGWSSQPNWSFVPTAITNLIFGKNILGIRWATALIGTLSVLFVYLAGRDLFNPSIGLLAAAFLATMPYHLHFSRIGVHNIVDSLMSSLVFWLIARAIKKDDPRLYYTAGAMAGLTIYTYVGTRLVMILVVGMLLFLIIRQRSYFLSHWKHLAAFSVAAFVSAAPQVAFFARHPDIFVGRLGQEGILFNGWLPQHAMNTGKSVLQILFDQLSRTVMVFIATPALGNFFNSPYPYLTIFGSILFLLGMGYALAYLFDPKYFMILMWFWAVILFGGMLTMNPPANTRLLMTTPAVALFMALGTYKILEYLGKFRLVPERLFVPLFFLVASVITYQNVSYYMFEYRENMYFQDANGEYAMEIGMMARDLGEDLLIFVLGEPRVYSGFPTLSYIAPNNARTDLGAGNISILDVQPGQKVGFFATPENQGLLAEIRQRYPGGHGGLVYRKTKPNELLFEYYLLLP